MLITLSGRLLSRGCLVALLSCSMACVGEVAAPPDGVDPGDDDDGSDDPDSPGGGEELALSGSYELDSTFDLVSSMPGDVGEVTQTIVDMTDDPYDPATWLLDRLLEEWDGGFVEDLVDGARPLIDGLIYEAMIDYAPELVTQLLAVSQGFGEATQNFGVDSTLLVDDDGMAKHTVTGYHVSIDDQEYTFSLAELGSDPVVVEGVEVGLGANNQVSIAEHGVAVRYGGLLTLALEDAVIPMVDPTVDGLAGLLDSLIDCSAVGDTLAQEIGYGSSSFYQGLCEMGIEAGAEFVLDQLADIDQQAQVTLIISGAARGQDSNNDRTIDRLTTGKWNGAIDYAGSSGDLADDGNTFSGQRN